MDDDPLGPLIAGLQRRLSPAQRKALATRIAIDLQRANIAREKANLQPDGTAMQPRKPHTRPTTMKALRSAREPLRQRIAAGRMFRKAANARYLQRRASADGAEIGFAGAAARIMRVHQLGLRDQVSRQDGAPSANYPERVVIGESPGDHDRLRETILHHLDWRPRAADRLL